MRENKNAEERVPESEEKVRISEMEKLICEASKHVAGKRRE